MKMSSVLVFVLSLTHSLALYSFNEPTRKLPGMLEALGKRIYEKQAIHSSTGPTPPPKGYIFTDDDDLFFNNATIFIADSGTTPFHPFLKKSLRHTLSYDVSCNEEDVEEDYYYSAYPFQGRGHGTHVHGITLSACPECHIAFAKTFGQCSYRGDDGVLYAVAMGASVVNFSAGSQYYVDCENPTRRDIDLCLAIEVADARNTLIVAASGNNDGPSTNQQIDFPANDPRVVAVGGLDQHGFLWQGCDQFTNGIECASSFGPEQEFMAPAENVLSTMYPGWDWNLSLSYPCGDSSYDTEGMGYCSGTSMSAPHLTGLFGQLKSVLPAASNQRLRQLMRGDAVHDALYGYGEPDLPLLLENLASENEHPTSPLFAVYSELSGENYFTVSPQLAMAKIDSEDEYRPFHVQSYTDYPTFKLYKSLRPSFKGEELEDVESKAVARVFTTPHPTRRPLLRLVNGEGDYFYTTDEEEFLDLQDDGYRLEGQEGYLFHLTDYEAWRIYAEPIAIEKMQLMMGKSMTHLIRTRIMGEDTIVTVSSDKLQNPLYLNYVQRTDMLYLGSVPRYDDEVGPLRGLFRVGSSGLYTFGDGRYCSLSNSEHLYQCGLDTREYLKAASYNEETLLGMINMGPCQCPFFMPWHIRSIPIPWGNIPKIGPAPIGMYWD